MAIDLSYPAILTEIAPYKTAGRTESAAFLVWFLVNYYHLDELEAIDAVCDQSGDKGVDGIYVNEGAGTIDILQAKISQKALSSIGDVPLKEFHGTLAQFESDKALATLIETGGDAQVVTLVKRLALAEKLQTYKVRGIFVANLDADHNGSAFLATVPIVLKGKGELQATYVSDKKDPLQQGKAEFNIFGVSVSDYGVDANIKATIAPVLANELVQLAGIPDQSLFASNVRASLGSTNVNKGIAKSIQNKELHKAFPLFHNGITVLAKAVDHTDEKIVIEDYYVVNGCQSLNTLWSNRQHISGDLRLLTKFIQVGADTDLARLITTYSNNQNGVKARDFKSNDAIQTRLQNEIKALFGDDFALAVKRGEPIDAKVEISNEEAGLLLIAFDLGEPWTTHRKYQIFDDRYAEVFGRPEVTASRLVMLEIMSRKIAEGLQTLTNQLVGKYVLTRYLAVHALRKILEEDPKGLEVINSPHDFVKDENTRLAFANMLDTIIGSLMIDLDVETKDLDSNFDYRGKLRDKVYVTKLANELVALYRKDVQRRKVDTVSQAWATAFDV